MVNAFREGGFGMYPTLAFGLLLLAVGLAYALKPERKLVAVFAILGAVDFLSGLMGATMGFITTFMHVSKLPEDQQFGVTLVGIQESLQNVSLALIFLVLSTLILAAGTLRAALRAGPEKAA